MASRISGVPWLPVSAVGWRRNHEKWTAQRAGRGSDWATRGCWTTCTPGTGRGEPSSGAPPEWEPEGIPQMSQQPCQARAGRGTGTRCNTLVLAVGSETLLEAAGFLRWGKRSFIGPSHRQPLHGASPHGNPVPMATRRVGVGLGRQDRHPALICNRFFCLAVLSGAPGRVNTHMTSAPPLPRLLGRGGPVIKLGR